ncbi:hypothetical protein B0T24DRAFT_688244 [Lasiosphaeria ovina]|uniref:Uncharacterized protein n=1 Tax=Lasiosphaeria ovina TaxID=92902 RepID=A0AAE0TY14_9PEZI|nr:hypothetical protein B0T24DRAFT_688244 [Lasiosphaeria ovina]
MAPFKFTLALVASFFAGLWAHPHLSSSALFAAAASPPAALTRLVAPITSVMAELICALEAAAVPWATAAGVDLWSSSSLADKVFVFPVLALLWALLALSLLVQVVCSAPVQRVCVAVRQMPRRLAASVFLWVFSRLEPRLAEFCFDEPLRDALGRRLNTMEVNFHGQMNTIAELNDGMKHCVSVTASLCARLADLVGQGSVPDVPRWDGPCLGVRPEEETAAKAEPGMWYRFLRRQDLAVLALQDRIAAMEVVKAANAGIITRLRLEKQGWSRLVKALEEQYRVAKNARMVEQRTRFEEEKRQRLASRLASRAVKQPAISVDNDLLKDDPKLSLYERKQRYQARGKVMQQQIKSKKDWVKQNAHLKPEPTSGVVVADSLSLPPAAVATEAVSPIAVNKAEAQRSSKSKTDLTRERLAKIRAEAEKADAKAEAEKAAKQEAEAAALKESKRQAAQEQQKQKDEDAALEKNRLAAEEQRKQDEALQLRQQQEEQECLALEEQCKLQEEADRAHQLQQEQERLAFEEQRKLQEEADRAHRLQQEQDSLALEEQRKQYEALQLRQQQEEQERFALGEQRKLQEEADRQRQAYQLQQQQDQERLAFEEQLKLQEEADRAHQLQQEQDSLAFEEQLKLQEEADRAHRLQQEQDSLALEEQRKQYEALQLRQQQEEQERFALGEQRKLQEEADRAHQHQQEKETESQPKADFDFNTMPTPATANLAWPSPMPIFNPFATPITAANPAVLSPVPPIQFGTSTSPRPTVNPISFGLKGPSVPAYPSDINSPKLMVESSFLSGEALKTVNDCKYEHVGWKVEALVQNRSADKLAEAKAEQKRREAEEEAEQKKLKDAQEEADRLYCQNLAATLMAVNARLDAEAAQSLAPIVAAAEEPEVAIVPRGLAGEGEGDVRWARGYEERLIIPDVPPTPDFSHGSGIVPVDEEDDLEAMWHTDAAEEAAAAATDN